MATSPFQGTCALKLCPRPPSPRRFCCIPPHRRRANATFHAVARSWQWGEDAADVPAEVSPRVGGQEEDEPSHPDLRSGECAQECEPTTLVPPC